MLNYGTKILLILATGVIMPELTWAQESLNASGGDATGSGGTIAYSFGQVAFTTNTGISGSVAQGVQHAHETFIIGFEEEFSFDGVAIFPIPTAEILQIEFENYKDDNAIYQLIDSKGRILKNSKIQNEHTLIEMSSYKAGTYLLNIIDEEENLKSFKIVKQ
jgi:hypothetical protein